MARAILTHCFSVGFEEPLWGLQGLNRTIAREREALSLCPQGHQGHPEALFDLALSLFSRYELLGGVDDLNEATTLQREALWLLRQRNDSSFLENLAGNLIFRFQHLGEIDDLYEAIDLAREAVLLHPQGQPDRATSINNLVAGLLCRYIQLGGMDDLNEAIVLTREALSVGPLWRSHSVSLGNLASSLAFRYQQLGGMDDLNEAIVLYHEAHSQYADGDSGRPYALCNLATGLVSRYKQLGEMDDLNEAIALGWEALSSRQLGHPSRPSFLWSLASSCYIRFTHLHLTDDKQTLFSLYFELEDEHQTLSADGLQAARAWVDAAEEFNHPSTIPAYESALRLLVEYMAATPPQPRNLALLKSLSSSLAADAFSACLRNQSPTKAIELLEQGRTVFWSQLTRLRSPIDDVMTSGPLGAVLVHEYKCQTSLIRNFHFSRGADQDERVSRINRDLNEVVSQIRELPGQSRFLLPPLFSDLQRAASEGPVIVMNASKYSCDALILFVDKDPVHIPLPVTQEYVQGLSSTLRHLMNLARSVDTTKDLMSFLRELWEEVVSHVVNVLQTTCSQNARIWWCPTAEFSLLPLHAASPHRKGQKGVSDLYVSSYTTTLTALIHARQISPLDSANGSKRILAIGQAAAKNASAPSNVDTELSDIGQLVDGLATLTRVEGKDACMRHVVNALDKHEWVHFACHGYPSQGRPFNSAFVLHEDRFTIERLIQCELEGPEFAYLSACHHTDVGDKEIPEVIHLAAAMQFARFRSVVGTMWAVDDFEAKKIALKFYELMVDDLGCLDWERAPRALQRTMKRVDIPMDQRILYVHVGI